MTGPAAPPDAPTGPTAREKAFARGLLLAVVAAYVLVQVALFSFDRAPRWDEAVYLSQVTPGSKAAFYTAFRARGLPLLIAPVTWWGGSVAAVRLFLTGVTAVAMTGAFWVLIPLVGISAPVAAILFGFSWMGLLNGSEIFPNLLAAILGLAVVGLVCRRLADEGRWTVVVASTLMTVLAIVRPTEATAVFGALVVYLLVFKRSSLRVLLPIGLGLGIGWLPWMIEMSVRFGGPLNAFDEAGTAHFALDSVGSNVRQYLSYSDGWLAGPEGHPVPLLGVFWWSWLILLAVVGVARRRSTAHDLALSCSLGALVLGSQYVILLQDRALAPRYLLPAMAFISVPAAVGSVSMIRGRVPARVAGAMALLLVIPWGVWQAGVADRVEAQEVRFREPFRAVGLELRQLAGGRPCSIVSVRGNPQIALASGCETVQVTHRPTPGDLEKLSSNSNPTFVVLIRPPRPGSPLSAMNPVVSSVPGGRTWFIYQFPTDGSGTET